ncbi:ribosomal protein L7/L12 (plasmid) [Polymorphobacter sp. PAMC 29334]|uniref:ribosomal protein L7/L12 n=1 Tax=Polymorphobacter sp. PAMC 29334 TaxID=2862331 RepID=UPI001C73E824|nr:ribosomal protein L7/L12 [Polymorphobacter sp. PAMC 29334]QYE32949.1 ribosomal protein L7/L12 [Polymorphobacter sp. PAMC 29334]
MMTASVIVFVVVILIIFAFGRARAGRKRLMNRLGAQVAQSMQSGAASETGTTDLGQNIAEVLQKALEANGLGSGRMSVTTTVTTSTGNQTSVAGTRPLNLGVGDILSVSSLTGARIATVQLDAIGEPKRRVTVDVPSAAELERGDRIYVELDPVDSSRASLPVSLGKGYKLPAGMSRLDAVVLGPSILLRGAEAMAVVRAANEVPLANPALGATGASKWRLDLEVSPKTGFPYQADLTITLSSAEKVARICHRGAEVPVRYDPADPKTLTIDSPAMGYAIPYDALAGSIASSAPKGSMIEQIAAVRAQQGVSLREAKDMVERMNAGMAPPSSTHATIDWAALQNMGVIERVKIVRQQTGLDLKDAKDLVEMMSAAGMTGSDATERMMAMLSGKRQK